MTYVSLRIYGGNSSLFNLLSEGQGSDRTWFGLWTRSWPLRQNFTELRADGLWKVRPAVNLWTLDSWTYKVFTPCPDREKNNGLVVVYDTTWKHPPHSKKDVQFVYPLVNYGPTCSCLSSQRSTMGWLAMSDERAVSLWNSLWLAHVPASRGRLRYVSIPLPCKDTESKVL